MGKRTITEMNYDRAKRNIAKSRETIAKLENGGVLFINPESCYVEEDVKIGKGTVVEQNVMLQGDTVIGENCIIGMGSKLVDTEVGDGSELLSVVAVPWSRPIESRQVVLPLLSVVVVP